MASFNFGYYDMNMVYFCLSILLDCERCRAVISFGNHADLQPLVRTFQLVMQRFAVTCCDQQTEHWWGCQHGRVALQKQIHKRLHASSYFITLHHTQSYIIIHHHAHHHTPSCTIVHHRDHHAHHDHHDHHDHDLDHHDLDHDDDDDDDDDDHGL